MVKFACQTSLFCKILLFIYLFFAESLTELELSTDTHKFFEDQREEFDSPASLPLSRSQAFKDGRKQGIIDASDIEVSFDNFPYYLRYCF